MPESDNVTIRSWQALLDSLTIRGTADPAKLWRPSAGDIKTFEETYRFRLPDSYKKFIQVFGPGRLCDIEIAAPGALRKHRLYDLSYIQHGYRQQGSFKRRDPDRLREARLVYFALKAEQDWVAWDPLDLRSKRAHEYGIYLVDSPSRKPCFQFIAGSFRELMEQSCRKCFSDPEWDQSELGPVRYFEPAGDYNYDD